MSQSRQPTTGESPVEAIKGAYTLIKDGLHYTPILTSKFMDALVPGLRIYFKAELFQKTGSFKYRGASHAFARLSPEELQRGVITHSSGNHGAAVAAAAQMVGIKCDVIMPDQSSAAKIAAVQSYGAQITFVSHIDDRAPRCQAMLESTGAIFLPPGDHEHVFLGAGTTMYEFQQQMSTQYHIQLDAIVLPIGMGGLISGCALACDGTRTRVFGAEPILASQCTQRLQTGDNVRLASAASTIADGVRIGVADSSFAIIQKRVEEVFTVTDEQIAMAMKILWERLKVTAEPSAAVAVAVVLFHDGFKKALNSEGNVGIILEGGNVDTSRIEAMMPWTRFGRN